MNNVNNVTSIDLVKQNLKLFLLYWKMIHNYRNLNQEKKIMAKTLLNQRVFLGKDRLITITKIIARFYGLYDELFIKQQDNK